MRILAAGAGFPDCERQGMERPTPGGEMPEGWAPLRWLAFVTLAEGGTTSEAANAVGRSRGTVAGWIKQWREEFGDDVLTLRKPGFNEGDRAAAEQGGAAIALKWAGYREQAAAELGQAAGMAAALATAAVQSIAADPEKVAALDVRDILYLARTVDYLAGRADKLLTTGAANNGMLGGGAAAEAADGVDLSGLEQAALGEGFTDVLSSVEIIVNQYRQEVIEVNEHDEDEGQDT